ncbi:MAG: hypothetical protein E7Z72_00655 [Methanocorpusculum parvum]|nr:hypothetical protein [Methanocorpusculum parvum]
MQTFSTPPTIQVYGKNLELQTEISSEVYEYFRYERNFRVNGAFTLHINKNHPKAPYLLAPDALAVVYYDGKKARAGIIETVECSISENGAAGETLIISGREGGTLTERLAIAATGINTGYDVCSGDAESCMRYFVDRNCINALDSAGKPAPNRKIPHLILEPQDENRGEQVAYSARFETVADILETLGYAGGIGWEIIFDRASSAFVFSILPGEDHTQGTSYPVILKPEWHTVESLSYMDDRVNSKTMVYIGGDGEAAERTVAQSYLGTAEPSGFERREFFVDASDSTTAEEIGTVALSELQAHAPSLTISAVAASSSQRYVYQTDYDLGDWVTVDYTGIATIDIRIIGIVDEVVAGQRGSIRKITLHMGTEPADIRRIVKQHSRKTIEARK